MKVLSRAVSDPDVALPPNSEAAKPLQGTVSKPAGEHELIKGLRHNSHAPLHEQAHGHWSQTVLGLNPDFATLYLCGPGR